MPTDALGMPTDLPDDDVVVLLVEQHRQIRGMFDDLQALSPSSRRDKFHDLRVALAVHETAEELVLRPVTGSLGRQSVADERNAEERTATRILEKLEEMDPEQAAFDDLLADLRTAVLDQADKEEAEEFHILLRECDADQRRAMGRRVRIAESIAPTRPHPSVAGMGPSQRLALPFAAVADRVRDALERSP